MTTSVADKTPIPAKAWRRHNDPPGLWFAVTIGSVSLHLLAFWLIRSSNSVGLWFPQPDQSNIPIELIEISPQNNSTGKPASSTPQESALTTTTKPAPENSTDQDAEIINSIEQPQTESNNNVAQLNREVSPQPEPTTTPTPTPTKEAEPTPTTEPEAIPTPTPTVPIGERPWNRRQEIELGQGKPLPSDIPSVTPEQIQESQAVDEKTPRDSEDALTTPTGETANTPTDENSSNPDGETANTPTDENSSTATGENGNTPTDENSSNPNGETANTPTNENSSTATGETAKIPTEQYTPTPTEEPAKTPTEGNSANSTDGGAIASGGQNAIATLASVPEAEARQLANDLPEILSEYQGSSRKTVDSSYLPGDSAIKPAQLLASLVIDKNGNCQQAIVLRIEPASLQADRGLYEQLISDLFKNENFTPGQNRDGTKPDFSNFFVRITIEPTSQ